MTSTLLRASSTLLRTFCVRSGRILSGLGNWNVIVVLVVAFALGCQGEPQQPTLDYSAENVELIRKIQGLEVPGLNVEGAAEAGKSESGEATEDSAGEDSSSEADGSS